MHVLVAILLFSSFCTAQTNKSNGEKIASEYQITEAECTQRVGVTSDFVKTNFRKDSKDVDEKFKCFIACIYENELKLKDDNTLDIESTRMIVGKRLKDVERNDVIKAVQACSNIKGDNACDTIFKIVECTTKILEGHR